MHGTYRVINAYKYSGTIRIALFKQLEYPPRPEQPARPLPTLANITDQDHSVTLPSGETVYESMLNLDGVPIYLAEAAKPNTLYPKRKRWETHLEDAQVDHLGKFSALPNRPILIHTPPDAETIVDYIWSGTTCSRCRVQAGDTRFTQSTGWRCEECPPDPPHYLNPYWTGGTLAESNKSS